MKLLPVLALTLSLCLGLGLPVAHAQDADSSPTAKITLLLRGYHELPSRDALLAASPDARKILVQIASDAANLPLVREHALGALATYWRAPEALKMYTVWVSTSSAQDAAFHAGAMALASYYPAQAVSLLRGHLKSKDLQRRITVATALKLVGSPQAKEVLRAAARSETNAALKATMEEGALEVR